MTSTTNQYIKPITTKINENGNLEVGGCDLVELAEKYGTPLYVIDEKTLRTICQDYKNAFKKYDKTQIMYASKALCSLATTAIIDSEGLGFEAVSDGELYTLYKAGVDMKKVQLNGNNKSFDELSMALDLNIGRISVDNFLEISMLQEIASSKNKIANIWLRITPGIECHTHEYIQTGYLDSKFGFDMSQIDEAAELIINECPNINITGLHAHVGSQIFETSVFKDEIEILIKEIVRLKEKYQIDINEINLGGGMAVKYTENDEPPSIYEMADVIIENLQKQIKKYQIKEPTIILEPGRSIISTAGITLYTIGASKQVPFGTKYIAVDGGMADNIRHPLYNAEYSAQIANKPEDKTSLQKVTIVGRFCESGDVLIENINLPNPEEGDILCIFNTGAYNYSMASNYNRVQKPAMVLVNNSQSDIIVNRETLDDMISHEVVLDRLKR